jgi:hypothetical protein
LLSLGIQVLGNAAKLIWAGFHCCCREVHVIIQSLDLLTPAYSKNVELSQLCTIFLYINYLHYQRCDSLSFTSLRCSLKWQGTCDSWQIGKSGILNSCRMQYGVDIIQANPSWVVSPYIAWYNNRCLLFACNMRYNNHVIYDISCRFEYNKIKIPGWKHFYL